MSRDSATGCGTGLPDTINTAAKLLGKWEVTKAPEANLVGAIITFEKEGKMTAVIKQDGQEQKLDGTYKVEKDVLTVEVAGNTHTHAIKKVTADTLELEVKEANATMTLKKKK